MPVQDKFEGPIAYNPAGGTDGAGALVPSAEFQVFDVADSSFSTPLAVFDPATGVTINPLRSSAVGVLPDFQVAGARREVLVRSGSFVTRLTSKYGVVFEAGLDPETVQAAIAAGTAAETARAAAVLAKTDAEAAAAEVADVVATNDGIMKAVAENPESAFSIELSRTIAHSDYVSQIQVVADPERFSGIDPTGVDEDSAALQAALDATPPGGTCRIAGKHRIGTALTNRGRSITIDATDAELTRTGSSGHIFDFYAPAQTIFGVTSVVQGTTALTDGTRSSVTITLAAGSNPGYVRGQIVKLMADDVVTGVRPGPAGAGTEQRSGEFLVVQSVAGNVVTCLGVVLETYTTNIRLMAMPRTAVTLIGGTFVVPDSGITEGWGSATIRLRNLAKPRILGVCIQASGGAGIFLDGCFAYEIDHFTVDFAINNPSGNQFGYAIADSACSYGKVSNTHGTHVRHVWTDVAPWVAANSSDVWKYGRTRATQVVNCSGFATTNTAFDTHSWSQGVSFVGCVAQSCFAGYALRGKEHRISDCHVTDGNRGLVLFTESSGGDSYGHRIDGLTMDRIGIPFYVDINPGGHPNAGARETRPTYISNVHVRDGGTMSLISNATLIMSRIYIEVATTLADNSRLFTLTNTEMIVHELELDYRRNTAGNSIAPFRVESGSALELDDRSRIYSNTAVAARMVNYVDAAAAAMLRLGGLVGTHAPTGSVVTASADGGWSDWETQDTGRNSGYIEATGANVETAGSAVYLWLGRTRRNVLMRIIPTESRTFLKLPDGKVRGQVLRIVNWATIAGANLTIPHGAATYNIVTKTAANVVLAPMDSITLVWNGSDWYHV